MDKVVVVGNCQAKALEMMLGACGEFAERFEPVSFPPVHEIPASMVPELHRAVAAATLVLIQRIEEGYRDGLGLGTQTLGSLTRPGATVVRWPSIYWAGYFPDLFYLRDAAGSPVVDGPFDYHDRLILHSYIDGLTVPDVCALLGDDRRPSGALAHAAQATAQLSERGRDCDLDVTPFIVSRFRDELLFFTMNHPTNRMLASVAQQVMGLIGIGGRIRWELISDEILGPTFYPIHANDARALQLRFPASDAAFKIRGRSYDAPAAVGEFFKYYGDHPELVELNQESETSSQRGAEPRARPGRRGGVG
jgi:hypothetical protein